LPTTPASSSARLVGGIAFSRLRSVGRSARVPIFTSLPGVATLTATPIGRTPNRRHRPRPRRITVRQRIARGRAQIVLRRLVPGVTYRLVLTIRSSDGQATRDTATLKVVRG
jgi:hypothetical protein